MSYAKNTEKLKTQLSWKIIRRISVDFNTITLLVPTSVRVSVRKEGHSTLFLEFIPVFVIDGLEKEYQDPGSLDVEVNDDVKQAAEDAIQVGHILCECAKGLESLAEKHRNQGNEVRKPAIAA